MGLLLSSTEVAQPYLESWWDDWNRVDNTTDTDQDRLLDAWEVLHGLERTRRSVAGQMTDESMLDGDNDGLSNFAEQLHGGDPNMADTDGDCIPDGIEVAWAQATALDNSQTDIDPRTAITTWDADGDGEQDSEVLGCDLGGIVVVPDNNGNNNNNTVSSPDTDNDGVNNEDDDCPDTPEGTATDDDGCSYAQRTEQVQDSTENTAGAAAESFFLFVMIFALLLSGGAYVILQNKRSSSESVKDSLSEAAFADISTAPVNTETWEEPVLDASAPVVTPDMLAQVPGWTAEMVSQYLLQGWTMDQLSTYYQEQVVQHGVEEQH
jgi:hypothetical protein